MTLKDPKLPKLGARESAYLRQVGVYLAPL